MQSPLTWHVDDQEELFGRSSLQLLERQKDVEIAIADRGCKCSFACPNCSYGAVPEIWRESRFGWKNNFQILMPLL